MLLNTCSRNKRRKNCEESRWRCQSALVRPLTMPCLIDAKISLVPKHQLIVPSTLLALATNIQRYKATKIHTLTPMTYELFFSKMAILSCNWPNSNPRLLSVQYLEDKVTCMKWKLYYSTVHGQIHLAAQFINWVLWHFQNVSWKARFLVLKGQNMTHTPWNSKTESQRSEPNWLLKYLTGPNSCAKFQPNRLTTTFGPWNTFSDNDTQRRSKCSQR